MKQIASRDNAHFKELKRLCQSGRERRKSGRIVLDGMHLVEAYLAHCGPPDEIVVSSSGAQRPENAAFLADAQRQGRGWPVSVLNDALFAELASVETPSGILAIAALPRRSGDAGRVDARADALLLDAVEDPGNLGSILRSAAAAGFRQVLLSPDCAAAWSPKALRAAMGAHFLLDIHEGADLPAFLSTYRGTAATTALDASTDVYALDLRQAVAWVFGNEGQGVSAAVAQATTRHVRIPMPGATESLNVAAAAAICLFETVRQRRAP